MDGVRIDMVNMYSKPLGFPDAPIKDPSTERQEAGVTCCNSPRMNDYLSEMNAILARYDAISGGECPFAPNQSIVAEYVSGREKRLNMVFQFDVVDVGTGEMFK